MVLNLTDALAKPYTQADAGGHYSEKFGSEYGFGFFYPPGAKLTDGIPEDFRWIVSSHWDQFAPVSPLYLYTMAFFWFFLWILNFFGNGTVMYLFLKTRYLRTPSNMFIVNLAFVDFIMMSSQTPPFMHTVLGTGYWEMGAFGCEFIGMIATLCGCIAIYTNVMIAYDRYNVIVKGFNGVKITSSMVLVILGVMWTWVLVWNILPLMRIWGSFMPEGLLASCGMDYLARDLNNRSYCASLFLVAYILPMIALIFFYSQIVKAVWDHEDAMREQAKKMNVESLRSEDNKKMSAECRIAKVAMTNVFLWICIWAPYSVVTMIGVFGNQATITPLVSQIPSLVAKTASCFNPLVYAISHPKYRQALQESMPWLCIHEPVDDTKSVASAETCAEKQ
uniref:Opsin n=1 Tax=Vargula tsujii TaxID=335805 RepID=F2WP45_9CRUS|nr:opsin [Vargula tsujii]